MITSTSNRKVREVQNLQKRVTVRRETGLFSVEGVRMFREVPEERLRQVYVTERFFSGASPEIRDRLKRSHAETVTESVFAAMSDTKTPQGVLALVSREEYSLEDLWLKPDPLFLILETIQDPGNLGTMLRAGEGAGLTGIIADRGTVDVYSPKVVRSTMGSIFRVPVVYVDAIPEAVQAMKARGIRILAAHLAGSESYDQVDCSGPTAFMIGNEAAGLSEETAVLADATVRIPMLGQVESLNAAVAASLLMYEAARQRRQKS